MCSSDLTIRDAVVVANDERRYLDPLAIFMTAPPVPFDNPTLRDLPDARKHVPIPYQTSTGQREPAGTRLIWPVACAVR